MCSICGHVLDKLPLEIRRWTCPDCGSEHHRDMNAAVKLRNLAASSALEAYRPGSAG
ncbi:MAG: zinc ribbon domain-containing protein [Bacillota bacterium]